MAEQAVQQDSQAPAAGPTTAAADAGELAGFFLARETAVQRQTRQAETDARRGAVHEAYRARRAERARALGREASRSPSRSRSPVNRASLLFRAGQLHGAIGAALFASRTFAAEVERTATLAIHAMRVARDPLTLTEDLTAAVHRAQAAVRHTWELAHNAELVWDAVNDIIPAAP